MKKCLICHATLHPEVSWRQVLLLNNDKTICNRCEQSFTKIGGLICLICGRPMKMDEVCNDCMNWEKSNSNHLLKNRSLFTYNEKMREVFSTFKFRGDVELLNIFKCDFKALFKREYPNTNLVVPIPLSLERHYERGFNQAELLAKGLGAEVADVLGREHSHKQSKMSKKVRMKEVNPFFLTKKVNLTSQHIVIIDDIYTTGVTVRNVAQLLVYAGAASCSSLTLIRS
ncbi:ComF family protein [Bacillus salitolerans]|uniref:ComF family protein n=1 Tax=Bacillus salitolerans TaxID=1437434 RepID=A0ABW4LNM0_9BACI